MVEWGVAGVTGGGTCDRNKELHYYKLERKAIFIFVGTVPTFLTTHNILTAPKNSQFTKLHI